MEKNVASQKWIVFAFDRTDNTPVTGDAANITANLRLDGGAANAVDDTNPTELEDGYYVFDLTQAETNADNIVIAPASGTADVQVIGVPGAVWTRPANFNAMGIESDGDLTKVNTLDGHTAQTGDTFAQLPTNFSDLSVTATTGRVDIDSVAGTSQTAGDLAALLTTIDAVVDAILADTGTDGVVLSTATQQAIADAFLNRDMSVGTDSGSTTFRTPRQALRFLRNYWDISGTTLTVRKEDDSTTSWTGTVSTDASADPVTGNNPAGGS